MCIHSIHETRLKHDRTHNIFHIIIYIYNVSGNTYSLPNAETKNWYTHERIGEIIASLYIWTWYYTNDRKFRFDPHRMSCATNPTPSQIVVISDNNNNTEHTACVICCISERIQFVSPMFSFSDNNKRILTTTLHTIWRNITQHTSATAATASSSSHHRQQTACVVHGVRDVQRERMV